MSQSFLERLRSDGVVSAADARLVPLTGGVSSDIYLVEDGDRRFVVKRALEKLKVEADWFADISRNETEKDYLEYVAQSEPDCVPAVIASGNGYFAMEYLGAGFVNWKQAMLAGRFEPRWAQLAGAFLGRIHRRSKGDETVAAQFDKMESFWQLRIDPYLVATGEKHPGLQVLFNAEAERLKADRSALVHGDFSPKNMLFANDRLVVLDCEVACYADSAFDLSFLITHLFLKALYHENHGWEIKGMLEAFLLGYGKMDQGLERCTARLLLMLLLARVDGKSPVEYLIKESSKAFVRDFVSSELPAASYSLTPLAEKWVAGIENIKD